MNIIKDTEAFIGGSIGLIIAIIAGALFVTYLISQVWNIVALIGIVLLILGVLAHLKKSPVRMDKKMAMAVLIIGFVLIVLGFVKSADFVQIQHPFLFLRGIIPSMNVFGGAA